MEVLQTIKAVAGIPWKWVKRAWRWFRQTDRFERLERASKLLNPYEGFFEMHGLWWRFEEAEYRNVPYCPICLAEGRRIPVARTEPAKQGETWFLVCRAHPEPAPFWKLTEAQYDAARGRGVPASQVSHAGVDRVRGEPPWSRR